MDEEMKVMKLIRGNLSRLTGPQRIRVLRYVMEAALEENETASGPDPRQLTLIDDEQRFSELDAAEG